MLVYEDIKLWYQGILLHFNVAKGQRDEQHVNLIRARCKGEQHGEDVIDALDRSVFIVVD